MLAGSVLAAALQCLNHRRHMCFPVQSPALAESPHPSSVEWAPQPQHDLPALQLSCPAVPWQLCLELLPCEPPAHLESSAVLQPTAHSILSFHLKATVQKLLPSGVKPGSCMQRIIAKIAEIITQRYMPLGVMMDTALSKSRLGVWALCRANVT